MLNYLMDINSYTNITTPGMSGGAVLILKEIDRIHGRAEGTSLQGTIRKQAQIGSS